MGFFDKLKSKIGNIFTANKIDDDFYDELEEALIMSDVGAEVSANIVENLRIRCKKEGIKTPDEAKTIMRSLLCEILDEAGDRQLNLNSKPTVVLVIGVNGVGKTTSIGKLAHWLSSQGKRVLLCAGDTFRAAAGEQLEIWANRANVEIIRQHEGADPAAVLFDAISAAKSRNVDVILCDTAGRLHNKQNLMNELSKISRVIDRELPNASRENLLVLDGTTGQNGLSQVKSFSQSAGLTGIVLTKLDGTAKGGVVLAIGNELKVPVKFVGVGEKMEDLRAFDPKSFVEEII